MLINFWKIFFFFLSWQNPSLLLSLFSWKKKTSHFLFPQYCFYLHLFFFYEIWKDETFCLFSPIKIGIFLFLILNTMNIFALDLKSFTPVLTCLCSFIPGSFVFLFFFFSPAPPPLQHEARAAHARLLLRVDRGDAAGEERRCKEKVSAHIVFGLHLGAHAVICVDTEMMNAQHRRHHCSLWLKGSSNGIEAEVLCFMQSHQNCHSSVENGLMSRRGFLKRASGIVKTTSKYLFPTSWVQLDSC